MSEQVRERGIDRTPDTLTELDIEKLREDLEALFSSEGAEAGWVALGQLVHGEEQEGDASPTPPTVTGRAAYELVMAYHRYFPEVQKRYFSAVQRQVDADTIDRLAPGVGVTIYGTEPVYGMLKDTPRAVTDARQPFQLEATIVDYTGAVHTQRAYPGQFTVHAVEA